MLLEEYLISRQFHDALIPTVHTKMILEQLFESLNDQEREVSIMHARWGLKQQDMAGL